MADFDRHYLAALRAGTAGALAIGLVATSLAASSLAQARPMPKPDPVSLQSVQPDNQDGQDDEDDDASDDDILSAAIGCVATYDTIMAQSVTTRTAKVRAARQAAYEAYRDYSGETDAQILKDILKADAAFPSVLAQGDTDLEDYVASCDDAFSDDLPEPIII